MPWKLLRTTYLFNSITNKRIFGFLCVLLFIFCNQNINAQVYSDSTITDNDITQQMWFDLDPSWNVGDGEKIIANFGYRTIWPKSWQRFIFKASYKKDFDQLIFKKFKHSESLLFGTGLFLLTTNDEDGYGSFEIRPFQGYEIGFNISERINLKQLFRFEERFVFSGEPDNQVFGLRFRYQVKAVIDLQGFLFSKDQGFYVPLAIEGFFNLVSASQFNDVIRLTPGLGYQFNKDFKVEGSLAYHYTKQGNLDGDDKLVRTNDIVFRFRIIKTFN